MKFENIAAIIVILLLMAVAGGIWFTVDKRMEWVAIENAYQLSLINGETQLSTALTCDLINYSYGRGYLADIAKEELSKRRTLKGE